MNVLVIGYGKIGGIKANIWRSLGRRVFVHDVSTEKLAKAQADGFHIFTDARNLSADLIVDISTPATLHIESLKWSLKTVGTLPRVILIEKPLASNMEELTSLETLLSDAGVRGKIVVNESYYLSSALKCVTESVENNRQTIHSIHVELSKNRLNDVFAGRFTDPHLGTLGIELPHMLALLQGFGLDIGDTNIKKVDIFNGVDHEHNEGFRVRLRHANTDVVLESYLGSFRIGSSDLPASNEEVIRRLKVVTDKSEYCVEFDPVTGIERYKSRITVLNRGKQRQEIILDDNHLATHLGNLHSGNASEKNELLAVDNALEIAKFIFVLKNRAEYHTVSSVLDDIGKVAA